MKLSKEEYKTYLEKKTGPSPSGKNCLLAFLIGGGICLIGECLRVGLLALSVSEQQVKSWVPIGMIALGALLTAFGVYDKIAKYAGAGTIIPITGFANSIVSGAMEFKSEGFVTGLGAKMFVIAGPVLVYGTLASVVYGVIYWITTLF